MDIVTAASAKDLAVKCRTVPFQNLCCRLVAVATQKNFGAKYFGFERAVAFCLGHHFSKHKTTRYARNLEEDHGPPGCTYVSVLANFIFTLRIH